MQPLKYSALLLVRASAKLIHLSNWCPCLADCNIAGPPGDRSNRPLSSYNLPSTISWAIQGDYITLQKPLHAVQNPIDANLPETNRRENKQSKPALRECKSAEKFRHGII